MDWGFIGKYLPLYATAARITIDISFFGIVASLIVGLIKDKIGEDNRENSLIKSSFDGFFLYYSELNLEWYNTTSKT